jgi:hypothetical protein
VANLSERVTSFTLGRAPQIHINSVTIPKPAINPSVDLEMWIAYFDSSAGIYPGAISTTFREVVSLCILVNSTLTLFYSPARVISGTLLLDEYRKYLDWKVVLPQMVNNREKSPPHVLCLHLLWHSAVLLLFRPFLRAKITDSDIVPQDVCRQAANSISEIFATHRSSYKLTGIWSFQIQCLLTACTIHIIHIPAIASTAHFVDACNSLQDLVGYNEWAKSGLAVIKGLINKWDRVLPVEAEEALYRDERGKDERPAFPAMSSSQQPFAPESRKPSMQSTPLEQTEKRSATTSPFATLTKKPKLEPLESLPELFAPGPSQPAPLSGPIHLSTELSGLTEYDGLDFTATDDLLNPFMGYAGIV